MTRAAPPPERDPRVADALHDLLLRVRGVNPAPLEDLR